MPHLFKKKTKLDLNCYLLIYHNQENLKLVVIKEAIKLQLFQKYKLCLKIIKFFTILMNKNVK